MKELREVENFSATSHAFESGDLRMVKVRRGKRGHRQSRSLVFRISRASKPSSNDSSIKCNSTDEKTSTVGEQNQSSLPELKIRIPKHILPDSTKKNETVQYVPSECQVFRDGNKLKSTTHVPLECQEFRDGNKLKSTTHVPLECQEFRDGNKFKSTTHVPLECQEFRDGNKLKGTTHVPSECQVFRDGNKLKGTTHKDVPSSKTNALCAPNVNEVDSKSNRSILGPNSRFLNDSSKESMTRMAETRSTELRRSSRLNVLSVQKDCQSRLFGNLKNPKSVYRSETQRQICANNSMQESPKLSHTFSFGLSRRNEPQDSLGVKRKRGRKPGVRATECKKRKYGKRGRPPKSLPTFPKQLSLVKREGGFNEKLVLMAPPKNSVWTLVPKKFFESEYFKSQALKVCRLNSSEEVAKKFVPLSDGAKQAKFPNVLNYVENASVQEKAPESKDPKRPTVIYFKKKFDQKMELRNPPKLLLPNRVSKTENDMLYLFNKYRMFKDIILKNYYELAGGNLNETENMLSNVLSNSSEVVRIKKVASSCERQVCSPQHSVIDLNSASQALHPASNPFLSGSEPPSWDPYRNDFRTAFRDTLSRQIIIQSLQILYSDEAILG